MRANRLLMVTSAAAFLIAWPGGGRAGEPARPAIDVSLVTPDDFAAIVIHPRRIAQSPLVAEQLKNEMIAGAIEKFGIDPSEVEEIVVLVRMGEMRPDVHVLLPTIITRFTHDIDAKEVLTKLQAAIDPRRPVPIKETQFGGKTCLDLGAACPLAYVPSKNTLILTSTKENMEKVVAGAEPKGPLLQRLKKADTGQDFIIVLAPEALADFNKIIDAAKKHSPPLMAPYLDAAKTVQGGTASFNLTAPSLLRVVLDVKDAEAADNLEDLLEQSLRMASAGLMMAKQTMPKEMQATLGPVVKLAEQFVDGAKAAKSGNQVTLDVKRPEILDTAGPRIVSELTKSILEARASGRRAMQMNNMHQISLAMLAYEASHESFPPATIETNGKPLLSWRVAILPFLDADPLYKTFHLDEPWDSPHNLEVAKTMPAVYQSPDSPSDGKTRVMLFTGKGAAFDGGKKIRPADIHDGASCTILCVEAGPDKAVPWTKPEDLPFDPEKPLAALGKMSSTGFVAAFFDGCVHRLKVDDKTLKALITPNGGEPIDMPKLFGGR